MATYNEERIEQILRRMSTRAEFPKDRLGCPDEERLASYLSGALDESSCEKTEQHLISCSACTSEIVAVSSAASDDVMERAPRWLIERATGLIKPPNASGQVVALAVKLVQDAVELVSSAADWLLASPGQPVFARGKPVNASSILSVERDFGGHKIGVEVEQVEPGMCQMVVNVSDAGGHPEEGLRITLVSGEREQASYITRQGRAVFESILKGNYDLTILREQTAVGTIRLSIEG